MSQFQGRNCADLCDVRNSIMPYNGPGGKTKQDFSRRYEGFVSKFTRISANKCVENALTKPKL